jgi:crossover junction endodeoxyribonuclease RuvC
VIVLGIDPGSRHMGWGVVAREGTRMRHVAHGTIEAVVGQGGTFADRLVVIERELVEILRVHRPTCASVEGIFYAKDAQAASKLGHARGVALLVCARAGLEIAEYPPARVKRTVAGGGRAEKHQVAQMVRVILCLREIPAPDAADALALAVTHLSQVRATVGVSQPGAPLVERALRLSTGFVAKGPPGRRIHGRKGSTV